MDLGSIPVGVRRFESGPPHKVIQCESDIDYYKDTEYKWSLYIVSTEDRKKSVVRIAKKEPIFVF